MISILRLLFIIFVISVTGCSWFQKGKPATPPPVKPVSRVEGNRIIDAVRLSKGGKLLIKPFMAGIGVAATDELDKAALMIVKGVSLELMNRKTPFEVLTAKNANEAELILSGHIVRKEESGRIRKWTFHGQEKILAVKGELVDVKTGRTVVLFNHTHTSTEEYATFRGMGEDIGQWLAKLLLSGR
jgi:hypothetical protein